MVDKKVKSKNMKPKANVRKHKETSIVSGKKDSCNNSENCCEKMITGIYIIDNFLDCITTKYFKFSGRANRREFWNFFIVCILLSIVFKKAGLDNLFYSFGLGTLLVLPKWAVGVRRLHDIGKSGWILPILLVPGLVLDISLTLAEIYKKLMTKLGITINSLIIQIDDNIKSVASICAIIAMVVLLYFYTKAGDKKANKYGEPVA